MKTVNWQGVYPALLTPFNEDDTIDFCIFEKNLKVQIDAGIDAAVLAGSLGDKHFNCRRKKTFTYLCKRNCR